MKSISERMKEALEIRNMKQAELVEKTGIGKSSISTYLSGAYEPKQRNIYKIAKALDVNESWLMGNEVPMDRTSTLQQADKLLDESEIISMATLRNDNSDILLDAYYLLNKTGKSEALKRVLELTQLSNYCDLVNVVPNQENLTLNAAHDNGATEEQKKHADDIMDNDDLWK